MREIAAADDAELAARAARGEGPAFDALALRWQDRIGRYAAAAAGGDADLAAQIAQESLVRLYGALPRFRGEATLGTLVYRLSARAAADAFRRLGRDRRRLAPLAAEGAEDPPAAAPGPEEAAIRADEAAALRRALAALDPESRGLIYLKEAEGMGLAELGRVFGLGEGTLKSRLSRIRARLRASLEEEGYGID